VRKLLLLIVPACLAVVPTVALATTDTGAAGSPADVSLVSSPTFVADPFHPVEARSQAREAVMEAKRKSRPKPAPKVAVSPALEAIAACESGGDPSAVSSTGAYRGKYQFSTATWQAVGGSGDPATAPEAEQDRLATILYEQSGPAQWPVCG
jgi:hypothetical protein